MMRILILGGNGMLGHKIWQVLKERYDTWITVRKGHRVYAEYGLFDPNRIFGDVFVEDIDSVSRAIATVRPDVVINAIGIIKQVPAASDIISSLTVNSLFPHRVATLCQISGTRFIHISTDCVFSGRKGERYLESDIPDADDLYGRSKLLGEVHVNGNLTLRTSLIGRELETTNGLLEWFLNNRGGRVQGYTNSIFSGLPTIVLAQIIAEVIEKHADLSGVHHVSSEPISKYDLLGLIRDAYHIPIEIEPLPDIRIDRSLDASNFNAVTGFAPVSWHKMLDVMTDDPTQYEKWRNFNAV
jgi:dTDP-4-dehydrorhamnose reductase